MSRVVMAYAFGGPEVLRMDEQVIGEPGAGQVRIRHTAMGVNFADLLLLSGRYGKTELPSPAGREAAGVVEAVGPDVTSVRQGQRVAYISLVGAFADERLVPADRLVPLPDAIDDVTAAAVMLKGMTAEYLLHDTFPLRAGHSVLVHAAAGGVGMMLTQWARHIGATVIGTVGSDAKAALARDAGCDHVINYAREDFAARVKEITSGRGVDVIYDGVGKDTFDGNMEACAVRGYFINYGHASGVPGPIDAMRINAKSMYFNKSNMFSYVTSPAIGASKAARVFEMAGRGVLRPRIEKIYKLADVAQALSAVADRRTSGSLVILP